MGKIKKILENELVGGTQSTDVYPVTSTRAVYNEDNKRLDDILTELESKLPNINSQMTVQNVNCKNTVETNKLKVYDNLEANNNFTANGNITLSGSSWGNIIFKVGDTAISLGQILQQIGLI